MSEILLTGGAGFIGSHTAVELLNAGYKVIIADDFSNSNEIVLEKIRQITGKSPVFYRADVSKSCDLERIFQRHSISAVMHFAGKKVPNESLKSPVAYYRSNLDTTLTLLEVMKRYGTDCLVFSSSASVYGLNSRSPLTEDTPLQSCATPYAWTKFVNERILMDAAAADNTLSVVLLRYFNPIGAHESGLLGDNPHGVPTNLMPYITQVAAGTRKILFVFGNDYPTPDGTGIRDYIHVVDLAKGHLAALAYAITHKGCEIFNLGTGYGHSVLDVVKTFERVNAVSIPYQFAPRRAGDVAVCFASPEKARRLLGWRAKKSLEDMCRDAWRWQRQCLG